MVVCDCRFLHWVAFCVITSLHLATADLGSQQAQSVPKWGGSVRSTQLEGVDLRLVENLFRELRQIGRSAMIGHGLVQVLVVFYHGGSQTHRQTQTVLNVH